MSKPTILGPQMGYIEMVNAFTQEIIDEKAAKPQAYNPLRPSAAGKCEMELGMELMEYRGYKTYEKTPNTPEVHRLLNFGYSVESHVIYEFKDAFSRADAKVDIKYRQQTLDFFTLPDGTHVEGNIDLTLISEKFKCVADIKSKKDKFSAFYKSSWEELAEKLTNMKTVTKFGEESYWVEDLKAFIEELNDPFFAANFYQLNLYFHDEQHFLRRRGIDHAVIFQLNKNDSRLREIRFKPSDEVYEEVKAKFIKVQSVVDRDKSPENLNKDYTLGSAKCAYCRFNKECWPDENATKTHWKTLPPKSWSKDIDRLDQGLAEELRGLFDEYEKLSDASKARDLVETKIVKKMEQARIKKIKLDNKNIYQIRTLKSGGPGNSAKTVIRRSKD